jgi:anthranilate/para-aminobenzoate synthase component I
MIVDLVRNDLGRVARPGGVRVEGGFPRLESYAGLHHLLADVVAELREGCGAEDALAALFPGGSISGAPKLASMAAIAREEREGRGFFSGSLGFVDARGNALWNILIRTLVWRREPGEFSFHVGGGITWSSDADAEERETLLKAARLVETLEGEA